MFLVNQRPTQNEIRDLAHGHGRGAGENLGKGAGVIRIEVLHEHEGHPRIRRQTLQQPGKRLQTARRSADADNRKIRCKRRPDTGRRSRT